jgi:hypothetical protein
MATDTLLQCDMNDTIIERDEGDDEGSPAMATLERIDIVKLLMVLVRAPWAVSYIEEFYIDYLIDAQYLDATTLLVSAAGRDFVALNESCLAAEPF